MYGTSLQIGRTCSGYRWNSLVNQVFHLCPVWLIITVDTVNELSIATTIVECLAIICLLGNQYDRILDGLRGRHCIYYPFFFLNPEKLKANKWKGFLNTMLLEMVRKRTRFKAMAHTVVTGIT